MKSLVEVNEKLTELHEALGQVIQFLNTAQEEIQSLKAAMNDILGQGQTVQVVRRERKSRVNGITQPNGDGVMAVMTGANTAEEPQRKKGWPKGLKRGPRKAKPAIVEQEAAA